MRYPKQWLLTKLPKFSILNYFVLLFTIYTEYNHATFRNSIISILEIKRRTECNMVLTTLRPNICLVVEKDCSSKIFNEFIENKIGKSDEPVFLYSLKGNIIQIEDRYMSKDVEYYIISPYINLSHEHTCYYYLEIMSGYMDPTLTNIYYSILDKLMIAGCSRFDLEEVHYFKKKYSNFEYFSFEIEELGHIKFTRYFKKNSMMECVQGIADELCSIVKHKFTKEAWSTEAVDQLISMLVKCKVLKDEVSLEEYPEIVPLIFPFKFVNTKGSQWAGANLVTIGIDLMRVEKSDLSYLFNIDKVRECCAIGGMYLTSKVY